MASEKERDGLVDWVKSLNGHYYAKKVSLEEFGKISMHAINSPFAYLKRAYFEGITHIKIKPAVNSPILQIIDLIFLIDDGTKDEDSCVKNIKLLSNVSKFEKVYNFKNDFQKVVHDVKLGEVNFSSYNNKVMLNLPRWFFNGRKELELNFTKKDGNIYFIEQLPKMAGYYS